jgi:hypothetical protein
MADTFHPLIKDASKVCSRCGYKLAKARAQVNTNPTTGEFIHSNIVSFHHGMKDMPLDMHRWISSAMQPVSLKQKMWQKKGTGEVSLHSKPLTGGGHELVFHSIRFKK